MNFFAKWTIKSFVAFNIVDSLFLNLKFSYNWLKPNPIDNCDVELLIKSFKTFKSATLYF